jgi:hypothetical protein
MPPSIGMTWQPLLRAMPAQPNYWRINGRPVLGINDYGALVRAIGPEAAKQRVLAMKSKGFYVFCSGDFKRQPDPGSLGLDAYTAYNAITFTQFSRNPRNTVITYRDAAIAQMALWQDYNGSCPLYPSCAVGWGNSPRIGVHARMVVHRSADQYAALITAARRFAWQQRYSQPIVFLSS